MNEKKKKEKKMITNNYKAHLFGRRNGAVSKKHSSNSCRPISFTFGKGLKPLILFTLWVECSPLARETWVQSQVASFNRLKKWYLIPPCLTLSIIRYVSRLRGAIRGKEENPPLKFGVVAIEKGAFGSHSTMVANFTLINYACCWLNSITTFSYTRKA